MRSFAAPFFPDLAHAPQIKKNAANPLVPLLRFTLDGDDNLEKHLTDTCHQVMAGIAGLIPSHRLEAVLLGGGYGRGEGGVLQTKDGERPYNDLEFYVCLRGNRHLNEHRYHRPLEVLGEILTPMTGLEIEFKITSLEEIRARGISMFSYDLIMGHRWLLGDARLLADFDHHRIAEKIPPTEATRLLMNRCSGLLFARERLAAVEFSAADADFVQRNIAKSELAFGDAVLTAHGMYHWSGAERQRRLLKLVSLKSIPWLEEVRLRHAISLVFKFHPERSNASRALLLQRHSAAVSLGLKVWLWMESRRLGATFATVHDYAYSPQNLCQETNPVRNTLVNLKLTGLGGLIHNNPLRHPRERIFRALSLLLWGSLPADLTRDPEKVAAYKALWIQVK